MWKKSLDQLEISGWQLNKHYFETIESTQEFVLPETITEKTMSLILTGEQTKGRGRGDRVWISSGSGLAMTFVLAKPKTEPFPLSTLSLLTGAALNESLKKFLKESSQMELKWPNDLLIEGKKIAGILLTARKDEVRIGLGLNWKSAPDRGEIDEDATRVPGALSDYLIEDGIEVKWFQSFFNIWSELYGHWLDANDEPWRRVWERYGCFNKNLKLKNGESVWPLRIGIQGELVVKEGEAERQLFHEELV